MADCLITAGRKLQSCNDAIGGTRNLYLIPYDQTITFTLSAGTAVVASISGLTTGDAFLYELKPNGSNSLTVTSATDDAAGTTVNTQAITVNLNKITPQMTYQLQFLTAGRFYAIVQDNMGNYLLIGKEYGATATESTLVTGAALADFNGYTLTIQGTERIAAYHLSPAAIATLITNTATNV